MRRLRVSNVLRLLSDHWWDLLLMALLIFLGMAISARICVHLVSQRDTSPASPSALSPLPQPLSYQEQLDSLDERVRALEHR
jgi:hypothetical protein